MRTQSLAAVVIFVASLAAVVYLEATDQPTNTVMLLAGPVVAALFINERVSAETSKLASKVTDETSRQNEQITRIEQQTNGVLDARIHEQTRNVLVEAGVIPPPDPEGEPYEPRHLG